MKSAKIGLREFENFLGFKNKIKWFSSIKIIFYHLLGVWWCYHYAFPTSLLTVAFAVFVMLVNGLGITCGAHRLFTHKAYKVKTPLKIFILICFTSVGQNSIYQWIRDHRLHHKCSDTEADPHNANRGLFFSHIGWLMMYKNDEVIKHGKTIDMSDIESDKHIMFFAKYAYPLNGVFCFLLPTLINILLWGEDWKCAVAWQWFLRYLYVFHVELSVNSFAHIYGYTPYNNKISPKQNQYVSAVTFGEGWHNYHHVFPFDYKAAEFCDYFDWSTWLINRWEKKGWAYDLKQASPEMVDSVIRRLRDETEGIPMSGNN